MKEKATIFDYARVCASFEKCSECILLKFCAERQNIFSNDIDKANEIILNWCKEHPIETRQDRFLKIFPNAELLDKIIKVCPNEIDIVSGIDCGKQSCDTCRKNYWLAEAKENEQ